ncbi:MAG: hypothetical protein WCS80_00555 [Bacilli bacterium]
MDYRILLLCISLIPLILLAFQFFSKWKYRNAKKNILVKEKEKIGDSFVLYFLPYALICIGCQIFELVFICKLDYISAGFTQMLLSLISLCFIFGGVFALASYFNFRKLFLKLEIDSPNRNAFYSSILVLVESTTFFFSLLSLGITIFMFITGVYFN